MQFKEVFLTATHLAIGEFPGSALATLKLVANHFVLLIARNPKVHPCQQGMRSNVRIVRSDNQQTKQKDHHPLIVPEMPPH